ncbi:fungal-specific transcription factor domain-containing protein [Aspergillus oleicola]
MSTMPECQKDRPMHLSPAANIDTPSPDASQTTLEQPSSGGPPAHREQLDISNPLHEPRRLFHFDRAHQPQFVGESTCLAFSDRILQCLNPRSDMPPPPPDRRYTRDPAFVRQIQGVDGCKLPERIRTYLLVRVALRFIGQDYHFFLQSDFLRRLDEAYRAGSGGFLQDDATWACKLFVVLALGELYSGSAPTSTPTTVDGSTASVPGTGYFLEAVGLLQDLFEEPSLAQIEIMLLFSFYSNALGRVNSAHMYSGMAMRIATGLGLHRYTTDDARSSLSAIEREHRVRLWWTVYVFDRTTCSRLGQPVAIQDDDIDVEIPSLEPLVVENQRTLDKPVHLMAHIELARITGSIVSDIYGPSPKADVGTGKLVQNVRAILQRLRAWDANIPDSLRWDQEGGILRSVASLQLHFNQCIILTTRPILLYVLKVKNPFRKTSSLLVSTSDTDPDPSSSPIVISETARTLSDACIIASRTSNTILSQLFIDSSLATFGYFDAHHLFSSTLVLIISAIISPNLSDSDAVQTAFQMLMGMRDKGNAIAGQYFERLVQIQWSVSRLFNRETGTIDADKETARYQSSSTLAVANAHDASSLTSPPPGAAAMDLDGLDWSNFLMPVSLNPNSTCNDTMARTMTADPLDSPLLQAFLNHTNVERGEGTLMDMEEMGFVL